MNPTNQPKAGEPKTQPRRTYAQAQAEGKARHNARLAEQAGAVWVRSLDGYVISEADLARLTERASQ